MTEPAGPTSPGISEREQLRALLEGPTLVRLRPPEALESAYQDYHRSVAIEHLKSYWPVVVLTIGLIGAGLFAFDLVAPQMHGLVLFGLAAFFVLVGVVVLAAHVEAFSGHLTLMVGAAAAAGVLGMQIGTLLVLPTDPLYTIPQFGVVLVTVAVFTISNLLFRPAMLCAVLANAAFVWLLMALDVHVDWRIVVTYTVGSTLTGAVIGFAQEMRERTVFLQGRLLFLEKREIDLLARKLDALSRTDGLTGLVNRRCFDETLAREWAACQREGEPVGLLFIDVDHFKHFNDHYGHQAGDDCLAQVGRALAQHATRPSDLMARYGGEEFVGLFPRTGPEGIAVIAARILGAVDALAIPHAVSPTRSTVSLSIGAASHVPQAGESPDMLVERADMALYGAKHAGRNRIGAAPP